MQPGIQTGGPFISVFYAAVRHWDPGQIGILLGCQSLAGAVVLFNLSNAATLPIVAQILSKAQKGKGAAGQIAAAVAVAEIVMIGGAAYSGEKSDSWGRSRCS